MKKEKTVFVLGAGASKTIQLPLQGELLDCIFALKPKQIDYQLTFMQIDINKSEEKLLELYDEFNDQRIKLADFIVENFASPSLRAEYNAIRDKEEIVHRSSEGSNRSFLIAGKVSVTLEDLFTLFDKIVIGREHFRTYSPDIIQDMHTALRKCIIFTIAYYSTACDNVGRPVKIFAEKLMEYRNSVPVKTDNLSVISMNWDSCLEKKVFEACDKYNSTHKKRRIYPDLCFYDYPYDLNEKRVVSTHIKAKNHRNLKLLKLHGSINWMACPCCGRVYVDYNRDIAVDEMLEKCYCPLCHKEFGYISTAPIMHAMLITPTFLKDLNDLTIKNVWHNALIELTEASKVIFIGYSFPDADFEMRCLLKKAIRPETKIDVVLYATDNPQYYEKTMSGQKDAERVISMLNLPEKRYVSFFGKDMINFYYCGMEEYLQNKFPEEVLQ